MPAAPTITVERKHRRNVITISNVSGATKYNLYWLNTTGVNTANGNLIENAYTPHVHKGLQNGLPYFYVATALDNASLSIAVALVTETDVALGPLLRALTQPINIVTETDFAQMISVGTLFRIFLATETDTAFAIIARLSIQIVLETDLAQSITLTIRKQLDQVTETDLAQAIGLELRRLVALTTETDLAQAIGVGKLLAIGLTTETDLSQAITVI